MERVSAKLEENKTYLQGQFQKSMDFMLRELELSGTLAAGEAAGTGETDREIMRTVRAGAGSV